MLLYKVQQNPNILSAFKDTKILHDAIRVHCQW